jgi:diaminopimelate epimerase
MSGPAFIKMHGLGNDFVVLDARRRALKLDEARARAIADRRTGVGCDQLLIIEPSRNGHADAFLSIFNSDGGEVSACGNGTRCAGALLMREKGRDKVVLETRAGLLTASAEAGGQISVDMGEARLDWADIPLSRPQDTLHMEVGVGRMQDPVGVNMGNPHAVFFVEDAEQIDLSKVGPVLEYDPLFPERVNVEAVQVLSRSRLRMRVWERGAGITLACGTGACAALVAAARRGLTGREAEVVLDGGTLKIEWRADGHVIMTGPVSVSFSGTIDESLLS